MGTKRQRSLPPPVKRRSRRRDVAPLRFRRRPPRSLTEIGDRSCCLHSLKRGPCLRRLFSPGGTMPLQEATPLHHAARDCDLKTLRLLLDSGADIEAHGPNTVRARTRGGRAIPPLHIRVHNGRTAADTTTQPPPQTANALVTGFPARILPRHARRTARPWPGPSTAGRWTAHNCLWRGAQALPSASRRAKDTAGVTRALNDRAMAFLSTFCTARNRQAHLSLTLVPTVPTHSPAPAVDSSTSSRCTRRLGTPTLACSGPSSAQADPCMS